MWKSEKLHCHTQPHATHAASLSPVSISSLATVAGQGRRTDFRVPGHQYSTKNNCRLLRSVVVTFPLNSPAHVKQNLENHRPGAGGKAVRNGRAQQNRVFFKECGSGVNARQTSKKVRVCMCLWPRNTIQHTPQNKMITYKNQPPVEDLSTSIHQSGAAYLCLLAH